jgi:aminoglycoside 3-N-acetyltransferase I
MWSSVPFSIRQLTPYDVALMEAMLMTFGKAFDDVETYSAARPSTDYLKRLLGSDHFIALAALKNGEVLAVSPHMSSRSSSKSAVRSNIYDLAVSTVHRREGKATALIQESRRSRQRAESMSSSCRPTLAMRLP